LVIVVLWAGWLLASGLQMILDSEQGTTREAVTDPSAAGFEAFVEQTWSILVATEDDAGELVQVAVVAVADRINGGGTVLLVPPETAVTGCVVQPCTLLDRHSEGGVELVRASLTGLLDVGVTGTALLTPARWENLAGASTAVVVELSGDLVSTGADGTTVVRFPAGRVAIDPGEVADLLGFAEDGDALARLARQRDWWSAWLAQVGTGDPGENLPALDLDVVRLLAAVAGGPVSVVTGPWVPEGSTMVADVAALDDLVVSMFPFPVPLVPGLRPTVRLLNGSGNPALDAPAREAVLRTGVELAVVGNFRTDGAIQTRVIHRDPALAEEANALAAALGARVLFDEMASPVTDLTVVIGADFHLGG
tara:strand:+ start:1955 stop:3049 length:1095 start_codon:yes stop_codon:yes gene_type:complete